MKNEFTSLLKMQQRVWTHTVKWNQVISLIKEISIERYSQKEFTEIVDSIVFEVFNENK